MKKTTFIIIISIAATIYFNSCAPLYVPNSVNTPMLNEKGDFNAAASYGLAGLDLHTAYALNDKIGIMVNGSYMNETSDSTDNFHKHIFVEAGAGYYKTFGKFIQFETYGGYGIGRINSYQTSGGFSSFANTYVNRLFLQPSIGFKSDYFQLAFAPRTVCAFVSQENINKTGIFIEPTLLLKVGSPTIKFITQFGLSYMLNDYSTSFNYEPFIFSFGLQYSFRNMESEKKY